MEISKNQNLKSNVEQENKSILVDGFSHGGILMSLDRRKHVFVDCDQVTGFPQALEIMENLENH